MVDARDTLERLIRETGEDYASLSRLLGRNAAYVQQFVKRGVPKKLDEDDRGKLARYFAIDETLLGGPPSVPAPANDMAVIARMAVRASAGPGAVNDRETAAGRFAFDASYLRRMGADPKLLSAIRVEGDSMAPTLDDGDDIMVDRGDTRLRDGIYVLRIDGVLNVKRLAINPASRGVTIRSDNPAYPDWPDCDLSQVEIVGRVIWVGRRL